jgi:hypothetical protein
MLVKTYGNYLFAYMKLYMLMCFSNAFHMAGQDVQLAIRVRLKQTACCEEQTVYLVI